MLADLLPQEFTSVSVRFELPAGWSVASSISRDSKQLYDVLAPEKAVFFVGRTFEKAAQNVEGMPVTRFSVGPGRSRIAMRFEQPREGHEGILRANRIQVGRWRLHHDRAASGQSWKYEVASRNTRFDGCLVD